MSEVILVNVKGLIQMANEEHPRAKVFRAPPGWPPLPQDGNRPLAGKRIRLGPLHPLVGDSGYQQSQRLRRRHHHHQSRRNRRSHSPSPCQPMSTMWPQNRAGHLRRFTAAGVERV